MAGNSIEAIKDKESPPRMRDEDCVEDVDTIRVFEAAPALIALHHSNNYVVVAACSDLRVFNLLLQCPVSLSDDSELVHSDCIRTICFGPKGKLFVSAGDDKLVKIWDTDSWRCIYTVCSEKRVSATAISNDNRFVCFADKFGVVWVVNLLCDNEGQSSVHRKAVPLFSHYCSIITCLKFSPDGKFIVSSDRDFKIRVTLFPRNPINGAHEIQSFCLGHTDFVSCFTFLHCSDHSEDFLVSGGGDSTVRLWNTCSGSLLFTSEVAKEAGISKANEVCLPAVTDLCTIKEESTMILVAIQGLHGVMVLNCDLHTKTLSSVKRVTAAGFIPTSLAGDSDYLWMVTGGSNLKVIGDDGPCVVRVGAVVGFRLRDDEGDARMLCDDELPGGHGLLLKLQGRVGIEEKVVLAASEQVTKGMYTLLAKKHYPLERREARKKGRNDRKFG